jgi:hypothetical protein
LAFCTGCHTQKSCTKWTSILRWVITDPQINLKCPELPRFFFFSHNVSVWCWNKLRRVEKLQEDLFLCKPVKYYGLITRLLYYSERWLVRYQ